MREYRTVPCMKWVKQLQAIAIKGFRGREPIWTYINNSTHHKYCFCMILLAVSIVVSPGRGAGSLCHEISSRGVSGLWSYAGQE